MSFNLKQFVIAITRAKCAGSPSASAAPNGSAPSTELSKPTDGTETKLKIVLNPHRNKLKSKLEWYWETYEIHESRWPILIDSGMEKNKDVAHCKAMEAARKRYHERQEEKIERVVIEYEHTPETGRKGY